METTPLTEEEDEKQSIIINDDNGVDDGDDIKPSDSNKKNKCCPLLHPLGTFKTIWDILASIAIIISLIELPFTMAFDIPFDFTTNIGIMSFCIDTFLCLDIIVTFRTKYYDVGDSTKLVEDPKLIAKRYALWSILDLITSFPFSYIINLFSSTAGAAASAIQFLRIIRLSRLGRVFRMSRMFGIKRKTSAIGRKYPITKKLWAIFKVTMFMLFCAHYCGCFWYDVGKRSQRDREDSWLDDWNFGIETEDASWDTVNIWAAYSTSFYWSVITLFTTGYGDITAHNTSEQWACVVIIVIGGIMTGYLTGKITSIVFEGDQNDHYLQQRLDEVYAFADFYGLSEEKIQALERHIKYQCKYHYFGSEAKQFVKSLPEYLQKEIAPEIAPQQRFKDVDLFEDLPQNVLVHIAISLKSIGFEANSKVFEQNDNATCIYILLNGEAEFVFKLEATKVRTLNRGDICGEYCIGNDKRRYTLKCKTQCRFYVLTRDDLKKAIYDCMSKNKANQCWHALVNKIKRNEKQRTAIFDKNDKLMKEIKPQAKDAVVDPAISIFAKVSQSVSNKFKNAKSSGSFSTEKKPQAIDFHETL